MKKRHRRILLRLCLGRAALPGFDSGKALGQRAVPFLMALRRSFSPNEDTKSRGVRNAGKPKAKHGASLFME